MPKTGPLSLSLSLLFLLALAPGFGPGCACGEPPLPEETDLCVVDTDCSDGQVCIRSTCSLPFVIEPDVNVTEPDVDAGNLEGILSPSDVEVEFGAAQLGVSVDRVLVLENTGNAPLTLQQVFINGDASGEFSVSPDGNIDEELAPQDSWQLSLRHTPLDGEEDIAELFIVHSGPNSPLIVALVAEFKGTSGLSVTDDLASLAPDTAQLDLGNVPIGAEQIARVFIRNDGTADSLLNIDNVYLTPTTGPFSLDVNVPVELESFTATCMTEVEDCPADAAACESGTCVDATGAPIGGVQAVIRFSPVDESTVYATLSIEHDEAGVDARRDISLVGYGVEGSVLSTPGTLHFMNALVGESATQTLRLQNVGIANVTIEALLTDVSGPFSAQSEFPVPRVLAPNETLDVDIQFQSPLAGDFVDELEVRVTGEPVLRVRLDGDARLPGSILVDDAIAFGDVYQGSAATYELRIRNAGPGPLSIRSMGITGPNATRFGLSPPSFPSSLTPLTSPDAENPAFVLSVYYTAPSPITSAEDAATLYLRTDDPANPEVLIPLSGFGIRPVLTPSVTTVDFGEGDVFSARPTKMLSITNTGVGPLEILSLTTENGGAFVVESNTPLPATLLANSPPLMVVLNFTPPSPGVHQDNLLLTSNDGQNPVTSVALTGAGTVCESLPGSTFVQTGPDCAYFCAVGFVDLDENLNSASSNGCEYQCTFTSQSDEPDDGFIDANCDGIDGMINQGIFVDATNGDDNQAGVGTIDKPYATLNGALNRAQSGDVLLVAVGTYEESLDLKDGVSIHGGYQPLNGWSRSEDARPLLIGGPTAITAVDISAATSFTYFAVSADDGSLSGEPSIGIFARNTPGLSLRRLEVTAGDGANGDAGVNGIAGDAIRVPTSGGNGLNGCQSCDVLTGIGGIEGAGCTSSSNGGRGGFGATGATAALPGNDGQGTGGQGGSGGMQGTDFCPTACGAATDGDSGMPGDPGTAGTDGAGGTNEGIFFAGAWLPSNGLEGSDGGEGSGGGGGGGGGGSNCCPTLHDSGGGGGGGGGGGCGGQKGTNGGGGGASFAVLLVDADLELKDSKLTAGNGGNGGNGGIGGTEGHGASRGGRGNGPDLAGRGGLGGNGGDGGRGGHGGGGGGGPSFCLYRAGTSTPNIAGLIYVEGNAGTGGASLGNPGANGSADRIK